MINRRRLVAGLLALIPGSVIAGGNTRKRRVQRKRRRDRAVLVIKDESSDIYAGIVQHQVNLLNAIMPKNGPRIVVIEKPHRVCTEDFSVCSGPLSHPWAAGLAYIAGSHMALRDTENSEDEKNRIVCHELMHMIAKVKDAYTYDEATGIVTWWHPEVDSCVHSPHHSVPGSYDRMLLEKRYGRRKR